LEKEEEVDTMDRLPTCCPGHPCHTCYAGEGIKEDATKMQQDCNKTATRLL
jgi:hypothetical protein